jgi:small subunit ribosomal protein S6
LADTQHAVQSDREYETIFILRPDVSRESSESISARVNDVVAREGGTLTRVENWGRRRLAYPVAKQRRGVYVYLKYVGRGGVVSELERNLRMLDDVIKYQTVKLSDEVQRAGLVVSAEDVKFEHVEPPTEADEDESRARILGLEDIRPDRADDRGDAYGGADEGDGEGSEEEGLGEEDDE